MVLVTHEQNIICSKTLICRQLFASQVVGSRPIKWKEMENTSNDNYYYCGCLSFGQESCWSSVSEKVAALISYKHEINYFSLMSGQGF